MRKEFRLPDPGQGLTDADIVNIAAYLSTLKP